MADSCAKSRNASAGRDFRFVVIGDTHSSTAQVEKEIRAINLLAPDLVLHVGDLIHGHDPAEWEESDRLLGLFDMPALTVLGNHDVTEFSPRSLYEKRYGPTYFSVDYEGVHFVGLDSEMVGRNGEAANRIEGEQLKWLEADLAANDKARLKFVFLHKPFWTPVGEIDEVDHWFKVVHPVLAQNRVNAVVAGHWHKYLKFRPTDGVHYYISGTGAKFVGDDPAQGSFFHFCLVTIRGSDWQLAVVKPEGIESDEVVCYQNYRTPQILQDIRAGLRQMILRPDTRQIGLNLKNRLDRPIKVKAETINNPADSWKISPGQQQMSLSPQQEGALNFDVAIDDHQNQYPCPQFVLNIEGAEEKPLVTRARISVEAFRRALCHRTSGPPRIDGVLDDPVWAECQVLDAFFDPQAQRQASHLTEARLAYDEENLYLSFRCREPNLFGLVLEAHSATEPVWLDDSVEVFLSPDRDPQACYQLAMNAEGVIYSGLIKHRDGRAAKCQARSGRENTAWTLEAALDWDSVGVSPEPGTEIALQVVRNRAQEPSESTQWSPTFGNNYRVAFYGRMLLE